MDAKYEMWILPPRKVLNTNSQQWEDEYDKLLISDEQYELVQSVFNVEMDKEMSRIYVCNELRFKIYPIFNKP